jgi:hypothetical protein
VRQYGAEPLIANLDDHQGITQTIINKETTIIYFLVGAFTAKHQPTLIEALGGGQEEDWSRCVLLAYHGRKTI